ncbi:hypothetical protein [Gymnodinialimonas sp. 57CJ19]|uniref:hypothetical protein n=1 Tax=Gymnodinialimonas sp. 57CJ19 TaxID=3138498 RepID=UPI0031342D02
MAYEMRSNPGSRLGIYADKIEAVREQRGLTPAGFRHDGTDPAGADKEAAQAALYDRADAHLPPRIGGPVPSSGKEASEEHENNE